jgi:hypothetical protein
VAFFERGEEEKLKRERERPARIETLDAEFPRQQTRVCTID